MLCLITGNLDFEYDHEPERTFRKRRQALKLAESSNLKEPTTKAMGDEQRITMGDYCKRTDNDQISLGSNRQTQLTSISKAMFLQVCGRTSSTDALTMILGIICQSFQRHVRSIRCRKMLLRARRSCICLFFLLQVQLKIDFNVCQGDQLQHGRSSKISSWRDSSLIHYSRRGSLRS